MDPKQRAGEAALAYISDGMAVGLGTGSTAKFFIAALGRAIADKKLQGILGLPTSVESDTLARQVGITVETFASLTHLDVTVDGADEIGPNLALIKGLGGALLREKLVAQNSKRLIIIADAGKVVPKLGVKGPLPVEVTQFGHEASRVFLQSLGCVPTLRQKAGKTFVTDNGNFIYDCRFKSIDDPVSIARQLADRAGIVESGLFLNIAEIALVADENSVRTITRG